MSSLQPNSPEMVKAALGGDEAAALAIAEKLTAQGPQVGYLVSPASKRALSRWVRRASISEDWAGRYSAQRGYPSTGLTPMAGQVICGADATLRGNDIWSWNDDK